MARDDVYRVLAGRLSFGIFATLAALGMYYANVRFAPAAIGFAILAVVCYAGRRRPARVSGSLRARPSLSSGDAARLSSRSTHSLGP